jgi:hypothetical protein
MYSCFRGTGILLLVLVVGGLGCSKKEAAAPAEQPAAAAPAEPQAAVPDAPAPNATPAAAPRTPAPNAARPAPAAVNPSDALVGAVHGFMTQQLQLFVKEKGRLPRDFSEFAGAKMDSVPRPPEGMMYVIDEKTLQVKVVKQR